MHLFLEGHIAFFVHLTARHCAMVTQTSQLRSARSRSQRKWMEKCMRLRTDIYCTSTCTCALWVAAGEQFIPRLDDSACVLTFSWHPCTWWRLMSNVLGTPPVFLRKKPRVLIDSDTWATGPTSTDCTAYNLNICSLGHIYCSGLTNQNYPKSAQISL